MFSASGWIPTQTDRLIPKLDQMLLLDLSDTELRLRIPVASLRYIDVSDHQVAIHTAGETYASAFPWKSSKSCSPRTAVFPNAIEGLWST
ncbi:MAG: hypothetical protein ACOYJZ_02335 [Acutalibacter sp.]|jgi:hypothetical protein